MTDTVRDGLARAVADVEVMTHPTLGVPVFLSDEQAELVADAALAYLAGQRVGVEAIAGVLAEHRVYAEWVTRSGAHYADCCDCGWRGGDYGTGATHQAEMVAEALR